MSRWRPMLGLAAGVLVLLSSAAHSLFGWKALQARLAQTNAPHDLVGSLKIGWQFGGAAMLAFGCLAIGTFANRLRGHQVSTFPILVVALAYLGFGIWALFVNGFNPFFLVFLVPAVMLLVAAPVKRS
jgi:hypothetical protein